MTSGEVLVWWPSNGRLAEVIRQETQKLDNDQIGMAEATDDGIILCHTWKAAVDPVLLPSLPSLPDFVDVGEQTRRYPPKLVKIGGMDSHIVGLTNNGHVVIFRGLDHEQAMGRGWEYVRPLIRFWLANSDTTFSFPNSVKSLDFASYPSFLKEM